MKELLPNIYQATTILKAGPVKIISAMHIITGGDEIVVIDPFTLSETETEALEALGKPTHILITGGMHVRDAEIYREQYGAKILANREAVPKLGIPVDDAFGDGETLPGGLGVIEMSGVSSGETIFRHNQGEGTLIVGDALMNFQPSDRGFLMRLLGFAENLGTTPKLFMKDKKLAGQSYRKLLDHEFDSILVSHGPPILQDGKIQLEKVVEALRL
ncbi:hypothetical protein IH992_35385 [Candidatus Poribacteria bacterium]|nr:hypothetical protein [Candidatus Poribacteria bacterium]